MIQQDYSEQNLRRYLYPSDFIKKRTLLHPVVLKNFFDKLKDYLKYIEIDGFPLNKININNKNVYTTTTLHHKLILRRCDSSLKKLFNLKVKNRHSIIDELTIFLKESPRYSIVRVDIKSFFESINQNYLLKKLEDNKKLSNINFNIIFHLLKTYNKITIKNIGIPRGLEISSSLSEIALLDFDEKILENHNIIYYGRFVDDIIIITDNSIILNEIEKNISFYKLKLNNLKSQLITLDIYSEHNTPKFFNYLGYKFSFPVDSLLSNKKKRKSFRPITITISDNKLKKIKTYISKSFYAFYKNNDFYLLIDRLLFLSTNRNLASEKSKKKIPTGIYFNYSKINDTSCLKEIDLFLKKIIFSKKIRINKIKTISLNKSQINKLLKINFENSHKKIIYKNFNTNRLKEITGIWK
ncbi:antiviral reverse transcriptase Drt3a [Proteus terrae]|uniref:antiviral reverse transcriptase Drt3a n=1 Tax=Proteus terrae TaxID=1574161 RepID=UPI0028727426|nr:antiviral reverse transcriptase Drt3a [Proteus terrae]MDR9741148.1 antiviral reverse transcriptase Drt3a [Proteus terrae]